MDGGVLDGYAAIFFHLAGSIRCRPGLAQEIVMNPFLHNPVALARAGASVRAPAVGASLDRALARDAGAGRRWGRRLGMLALAAGMSLTAASAAAMDVNSATAEQLQSLRGVGPKTAAIIIHERQRGGNFQSMEDLSDRVRGIGAKKARALQEAGLSIGPGAGAGAGPGASAAGRPGAPAGAQPGADPAKPAARPGRHGSRRGSSRP